MKLLLLMSCFLVLFSCENIVTEEGNKTIYVPQDFNSIQSAIDFASDGYTIIVDNGRYSESVDFFGKKIKVVSHHYITGNESYIDGTIIDGNNSQRCVRFSGGEDSTSLLSGFTITNGFASAGGGILCQNNSSPILSFLKIQNNTAALSGGGILCFNNSNPQMSNIEIENNLVESGTGGGIGIYTSSPVLTDVSIGFNTSATGGGIYFSETQVSMSHIKIYRNISNSGAGFYSYLSEIEFTNSIIYDNLADYGAGGYLYFSSIVDLINTTITNNQCKAGSGGFHCRLDSQLNTINSILWENYPFEIFISGTDAPNDVTISYSDIRNGENGIYLNGNSNLEWGIENIDLNPEFLDLDTGNFRLSSTSPCIDAGDPDNLYNDNDGSINDMGAFGGFGSDW